MSWIPGLYANRHRRRVGFLASTIEAMEVRALLADGITPAGAPSITAVAGVPINNVVFATYTVTDPSGEPGTQWRALINFGDSQIDGPVIPVEKGDEFEFVDTHTYKAPGTYTVTVMIALPGSHTPNDNTVTTRVTVTTQGQTPTPTPTPTPSGPRFLATGLKFKAREDKMFHGQVAGVEASRGEAQGIRALIAWGDGSAPTPGQVVGRGRGKFAIIGSHRYVDPGSFRVMVTIEDAVGHEITATSLVRVIK